MSNINLVKCDICGKHTKRESLKTKPYKDKLPYFGHKGAVFYTSLCVSDYVIDACRACTIKSLRKALKAMKKKPGS